MTIPASAALGRARLRRPRGRFLGLLAAGDTRSDSVAKGIRWLMTKQTEDGSWDEAAAGTQRRERSIPEQDFRGCFILRTTCTALFPAAGADDVQAGDGARSGSSSVEYLQRDIVRTDF